MDQNYKTVKIEKLTKHIILITLNRPEASNAFNTLMAKELTALFENLTLNTNDQRVLILTGSGNRAFCAGGDLKERNGMTDAQWVKQHLVYEKMARTIIECPIPIIGAINGAAYGGGCELVAMLDFVYVSENAKFAQTEVKLGIIPGAGGTQTLTRAIGERRAKELILTGKTFNAMQAYEWGLANAVLDVMLKPGFDKHILNVSKYFFDQLRKIQNKFPKIIKEIRGKGLMVGIQFFEEPSKFLKEFYNNKLITVKASDNVIRILPPLNVRKEEIDEGINIITKTLQK